MLQLCISIYCYNNVPAKTMNPQTYKQYIFLAHKSEGFNIDLLWACTTSMGGYGSAEHSSPELGWPVHKLKSSAYWWIRMTLTGMAEGTWVCYMCLNFSSFIQACSFCGDGRRWESVANCSHSAFQVSAFTTLLTSHWPKDVTWQNQKSVEVWVKCMGLNVGDREGLGPLTQAIY